MDQFWKSCAEAVTKRTNTGLLGTYTFFWTAYHWQGFYATFFVPSSLIYQKYGLLKNEYVFSKFFGSKLSHVRIPGGQWHIYLPNPHILWGLALPAILTYLYIWWLPKLVLIHAFTSEQEHKFAKKKIRLTLEQKLLEFEDEITNKKTAVIEKKSGVLEAEVAFAEKEAEAAIAVAKKEAEAAQTVAKKEKKAASLPDEIWSKDYDEAKNNVEFKNFNMIINAVYQYSGNTKQYYEDSSWTGVVLSGRLLAFADSNGLINLDNKTDKITLTDKGKYFVKRFQSEPKS